LVSKSFRQRDLDSTILHIQLEKSLFKTDSDKSIARVTSCLKEIESTCVKPIADACVSGTNERLEPKTNG